MRTLFRRFVREDAGQDLIEYALLAAFLSIASLLILDPLGKAIANVFTRVKDALDSI